MTGVQTCALPICPAGGTPQAWRRAQDDEALAGLAFMTDMAEKYNKNFVVSEMKGAETIGDLYRLYLSK